MPAVPRSHEWVVLGTLFLSVLAALGLSALRHTPAPGVVARTASAAPLPVYSKKAYSRPPAAEIERKLTPLQRQVTQHEGTEPPFRNALWNHHATGLYVDVVTGEPLFSSADKFDSGTGWPSFTRPVEQGRVVTREDRSLGTVRTEVRSRGGDSHLGHLFSDGPAPEGTRYCINSAALRFVPAARLAAEGYAEYLPLFAATTVGVKMISGGAPATMETALLAGGCFWGMEEILRKIPGVISTEVGYTGGSTANPSYLDLKGGQTGHAESVRVLLDPRRLSYADLLEKWFFRMHDPTTPNRQGNDVGTQYRSAIFATTPAQRATALDVRKRVDASGKWPRPVVTEVVDAGAFTRAEEYHQKYLRKNPGGYTCHYVRD